MAATAADLAIYVKKHWKEADLKALTTAGNNSASAINDTNLESACEEAIVQFTARFCTYAPDSYPIQRRAAAILAIILLTLRKRHDADVAGLEKQLKQQVPFLEKRSTTPQHNSVVTPTNPLENRTTPIRPTYDDTHFDGYL